MKKIVSLFLLIVAFASCSEEVKFNNPAFQANKDGGAWIANDMYAYVDAEGLTIVAAVGTDVVMLHTRSASPGTYTLGGSSLNSATYESVNDEGASYESVSGEIKITSGLDGTVTGKFNFVGDDGEGNEVNFTQGNFYKVPKR